MTCSQAEVSARVIFSYQEVPDVLFFFFFFFFFFPMSIITKSLQVINIFLASNGRSPSGWIGSKPVNSLSRFGKPWSKVLEKAPVLIFVLQS